MKLKLIAGALAGSLLALTSFGQSVTLVLTGSTAFRPVDLDRLTNLFDPGYSSTLLSGNNYGVWVGTMQQNVPSLGTAQVTIYASFSGSSAGMQSVAQGIPVPCINLGDTQTNFLVPNIAFSDVYPDSAVSIANGSPSPLTFSINPTILGVIPFAWIRSSGPLLAGITNITRDQALLLETAGGLVPASYFGGTDTSATNVVWFTGRNFDSGTRITTTKDIGFVGTPLQYANIGGTYVFTNGFSSSSFVDQMVATNQNVITYLGVPDALAVSATNGGVMLSYDGVPYSTNNVENGSYAIWGYEHLCYNTLSAAQQSVVNALVSSITNSSYQSTNYVFIQNDFVPLAGMQVKRGDDGAVITGKTF